MKTIIFDFDGVIHDTFELAYSINMKILGTNFTKEKYKDLFNGNIYKKPEINKETSNKFFEIQNEAFKYLKIEENIKNNLELMAKEYNLYIISSNQEKALNIYFHNNNFTHIFKKILGVETHKSKVEKFKYLFKECNLKVEECIFITDTLGDILEANKVGVKTIAVDFGVHETERLQKGNPFKIISNFDDILNTIKRM